MNKVILCGRLTRDPYVTYTNDPDPLCIARYALAVDRRSKREGEPSADFIQCVAFGKVAQFAEKYLRQGMKIILTGHIRTGSYIDRDGKKVYTTSVEAEEMEFAESKNQRSVPDQAAMPAAGEDGFMKLPDNVDDEGLPFN